MVKTFRPITPSQRELVLPSFKELTRRNSTRKTVEPCKKLLQAKRRSSGRNHHGHITSWQRGGGSKKFYRIIDFRRDKDNIPAKVASIEYDPNRTAFIALLNYADGEKRYILAPQELNVGDEVLSGSEVPFKIGCATALKNMPLGSFIHNIELYPGRGGQLVRSAGLSAQLMAVAGGIATIKMPSGEIRTVREECRATFGTLSNAEHTLRVEGKAGRMRWKGVRPNVRGTAMNPVDHPHGGGEGKHNGYIPQTPWAMKTKGFKTRRKKKSTKYIIKDRRA
jgi:large subunit ribosomal protein L2